MKDLQYITIEEADSLNHALAKFGLKNVRSMYEIKNRCNEVLNLFNPFLKGPKAGNLLELKITLKRYFAKVFSEEADVEVETIEAWKYTNPEVYVEAVTRIRRNVELRCNNTLKAIFENDNATVVEIAKDMLNVEKYLIANFGKLLWLVVDEQMDKVERHKAGIPEISYFKEEDVIEISENEKDYDSKTVL